MLASGDIELTQVGSIVGTPAYMAPEQHRSQVCDARSDQYSFCVALWEALYLERPFVGRDIKELGLRKLGGPPQAVPKGSRVPRWLAPVLIRALRPEPSERHADMAALLEALRRDPWRARRRALGGALAVAAAIGAGVAYDHAEARAEAEYYAARAQVCAGADERLVGVWDDAQRAAVAQRFTGDALQAIGREARATFDRYAEQWVRVRVEVCQATRLRGQQSESQMTRRNACLDRALVALRSRVDAILAADEAALQRTGELLDLPALSSCTDERQNSHIDAPGDPARVAALEERVDRLAARFDFEVRADADDELDTLQREAEALGYRPLLARIALLRGRHHDAVARFVEARAAYLESLRLAEVSRDDRGSVEALVYLIQLVAFHLRSPVEAETLVTRLNAALERIGEDDPGLAARVLRAQARAAGEAGRYEETIVLLERAIREHLRAGQQLQAATALGSIGVMYNRMNRLRTAIPYFERAISWLRQIEAAENSFAIHYLNMGRSYLLLGEFAIAQRHFERSSEISLEQVKHDPTLVPTHPGLALLRFNLGMTLLDGEDPRAALPLLEEALAFRRRAYSESSMQVAHASAELARAHLALGDVDAAERELTAARAKFVAGGGQGDSQRLRDFEYLQAVIAGRRGRTAEAIERLERVQALDRSTTDTPCRAAIDVDLELAELLWTTPARRARAVEVAAAGLMRARGLVEAGSCSPRMLERLRLWLATHPPGAA